VQDSVVGTGRADELGRLYEEHRDRLWRGVYATCGDPDVASDAVAEAFAQALRRGDAIRDPLAWVWRAAFRISAGELKARSRRIRAEAAEETYELPEAGRQLIDDRVACLRSNGRRSCSGISRATRPERSPRSSGQPPLPSGFTWPWDGDACGTYLGAGTMRERDRRLLLRFRELDRLRPPRPWPTADILRSRAGAEPPRQSPRWRRVASVAVGLAVAVAGITFGVWTLLPLESERRPAGAPAESIAFVRDVGRNQEILVMNGDGIGLIRLTHSPPGLPEDQAADIQPAWSPDATRIAFASRRDGNFEIYSMNADGSELTRLTDDPAEDVEPAWSPDGAKIAFTRDPDTPGVSGDIYVMNADGSDVTRLTDDPGNDRHPSWSPNGAQIAFQGDGAAVGVNSDIYVMRADGSGLTGLTSGPSYDAAPAWSPDGSKIAYEESPPGGDSEITVMNADGSGKTLLTYNDTDDADPDWSPDGSKIGFIRMLPDRTVSIFAINADGTGEEQLTNAEGLDSGPAWRPQPAG
jgi:hypothetical protein